MASKSALFERLTLHAPHVASKQMIPAFLYGTAWKKGRTADLVYEALKNGFTGIDTACQPKHYREDLVGDGLRRVLREKMMKRADVFLQTKYTPVGGQDTKNMPYNPGDTLTEQVHQSIRQSLQHLNVSEVYGTADDTYLDSVVLHSPMSTINDTMEVWITLESYVPNKILNLGVSNVDLATLMELHKRATVKPSIVQNRFYPGTRFDTGLRKFCMENSIVYQTFWTLSANPKLILSGPVQELSTKLKISKEAAMYCLVLGLGELIILNGTTSTEHMKADWHALALARDLALSDPSAWEKSVSDFKNFIR